MFKSNSKHFEVNNNIFSPRQPHPTTKICWLTTNVSVQLQYFWKSTATARCSAQQTQFRGKQKTKFFYKCTISDQPQESEGFQPNHNVFGRKFQTVYTQPEKSEAQPKKYSNQSLNFWGSPHNLNYFKPQRFERQAQNFIFQHSTHNNKSLKAEYKVFWSQPQNSVVSPHRFLTNHKSFDVNQTL